ncbi:hypothetical protein CAEBREN_01017 [Caenorhabditis brenneri]|uniref:Uncharacterized protein n=1 Tax=Caenorhabditis brenneri TaxID=135651 RepID=G0NII7_CAEBE|nr:hypothetical protein CAEBREN_01017 [Caenorhabditis brenneri]
MCLLLPLILVIYLACPAQANILDDAWGGVTSVFKSVGDSFGSWWDENAEKICPQAVSILEGRMRADPRGVSAVIWDFLYSCKERQEQGRVDNAAWWGKFGEFLTAMSGFMPSYPA